MTTEKFFVPAALLHPSPHSPHMLVQGENRPESAGLVLNRLAEAVR